MCIDRTRIISFLVAGFLCLNGLASRAQETKRLFTATDEIGLTLFGNQYKGQSVRFSPDGNYFVAYTEHGRLDLNCLEDSLRFYSSREVERFMRLSDESRKPS